MGKFHETFSSFKSTQRPPTGTESLEKHQNCTAVVDTDLESVKKKQQAACMGYGSAGELTGKKRCAKRRI